MPVTFQIQTFRSDNGRLIPARRLTAAHGPEAQTIAEDLVGGEAGAVVLHVVTDDFGQALTLTRLAAYGETPEAWPHNAADTSSHEELPLPAGIGGETCPGERS